MDARGATSVEAYLANLPPDRSAAIATVRDLVNANLPDGYEEGMQYGMISWYVPLARYPETYNGQPLAIAGLASQKGYMALYLVGVYGDPVLDGWFKSAFAKAGKKLDMGKSCVRFKALDALPLDVIGETIRRVPVDAFLAQYEDARESAKRTTPEAKAKPATAAKKPAAAAKKPAAAANKPAAAKQPVAKAKPARKPPSRKKR